MPRDHCQTEEKRDGQRVEWRVDSTKKKGTPSAETVPPGNHHPRTPSDPGSVFQPDTGTGDPDPGGHTDTDPNGDSGAHGAADRETHGRANGVAEQYSEPGTHNDPCSRRKARSPPATGLRGNVLRAIRR